MTRIACAVLAAACWLLPAGCTSSEERAQRAREEVQRSLAQGDRSAVLAAIQKLRAEQQDSVASALETSALLTQAGDAPEALWRLKSALLRFPASDELRLALARTALLVGEPNLAKTTASAVTAGAEQHAPALVVQAQAELALGQLDAALALLREAEARYPERSEARLVRIATLLTEHRDAEAHEAIAAARASFTADAAHNDVSRILDVLLAELEAAQGRPEGIETLKQRVAASPADLLAWRTLTRLLSAQGRAGEALALIEAQLGSAAPAPELFGLAAQLHIAAGRDAQAEQALLALVARSESPSAYLPLIDYYSARDDADATLKRLDEGIARFPNDAMLSLLRSDALIARERLPDARRELARFRKLSFAGDPQVDYLEARCMLAEGDANRAATALTELAPRLDRPATHFWLGRALEASGDTQGARRRYLIARSGDPTWLAPPLALLSLESRRGDWRAAAEHARNVVTIAPRRLDAWVALVQALESLGEGAAAEKAARECMQRFPERSEPRLLLARALRAQGRYNEALAALPQSGSEKSSNAAAPSASAEVEIEQALTLGMAGRVDAGIAALHAEIQAQPNIAALHAALASLWFAAGDLQAGSAATDRALALDQQEPRPLRVRCEARAARGDYAAALEDCRRYREARPEDAGAYVLLGAAYTGLGQKPEAIAAYREAARIDERDARARNNLAELLGESGDVDAALEQAQAAYQLAPANPYVQDTLGMLYLRKGLLTRAISLLEEARAGAPELPELTLHLAQAYREAGRPADARRLLVALSDSPASAAVRTELDEALHALP